MSWRKSPQVFCVAAEMAHDIAESNYISPSAHQAHTMEDINLDID